MKKILLLLFLIVTLNNSYAQINNLITVFDLPETLNETSGLIFYNNKLISHNDSGNNANLYEIDVNTGQITRTIHITNAENVDWEEISQDDDFIYIGDFGNNNGNRTDLKIYRINKLDYLASNNVTAEIIHFSYEDQTDFNENSFTNFDAEAMIIYNDDILIFTKNRGDFKTKAYVFSKTIGTHSAIKIGTYNSQGLITGATFNYADYSIFLTGYNTNTLQPFLIYLGNFTGNNIFDGTVEKTDITSIIGSDSQLEAITNLGNEHYYLSREEHNGQIQRVFSFDSLYVLNIDDLTQVEAEIYPNPFDDNLKIISDKNITNIQIYDLNGKTLNTKITNFYTINFSKFAKGTYFLKVFYDDNSFVIKKIIKK